MIVEPDGHVHATAVLVSDRGILISGPSGSGKSSIASELVRRAAGRGAFAALICDDQCLLQAISGRLICAAPASLQGGMEVRGSGLHTVDFETCGVIHLAVELTKPGQAIRFAGDARIVLEGVAVPHLILPEREVEAACRAVEARLFRAFWKK
ncbi:serine kinase of HPr protein (carbohydrate metabolism regulator) [Phyllobacterium trifolii]|jgi:serine kinase of HPr protein (carbohydrate metabolism regulator)|uniref:Serine kinase of HPr protein (Carbohydrate metabolism regulator) n=1 Tax=Phyllobacterium trifolii TaxID=300193 RepID=A0A839U4E4_9HYPH|nr:AAA family ATPase [Phyllobacterium trifolii]MBB3145548.1 serine kinase of HPr protein (carbohydrate metabolism regulator) [Phyllobacterium trifolii]